MITNRYHIASLVSIFLALGIGLLIGSTMGQNWADQTEDNIIVALLGKYRQEAELNQKLQAQLQSLQQVHQSLSPVLSGKTVSWVGSSRENFMTVLFESAGATMQQVQAKDVPVSSTSSVEQQCSDFIVVSDEKQWEQIVEMSSEFVSADGTCNIIDVSSANFSEHPLEMFRFMIFMNQISEEKTNAAIRFYHYTGLE